LRILLLLPLALSVFGQQTPTQVYLVPDGIWPYCEIDSTIYGGICAASTAMRGSEPYLLLVMTGSATQTITYSISGVDRDGKSKVLMGKAARNPTGTWTAIVVNSGLIPAASIGIIEDTGTLSVFIASCNTIGGCPIVASKSAGSL
jgi:hypothetical protein